jgi:hypothetical protein
MPAIAPRDGRESIEIAELGSRLKISAAFGGGDTRSRNYSSYSIHVVAIDNAIQGIYGVVLHYYSLGNSGSLGS